MAQAETLQFKGPQVSFDQLWRTAEVRAGTVGSDTYTDRMKTMGTLQPMLLSMYEGMQRAFPAWIEDRFDVFGGRDVWMDGMVVDVDQTNVVTKKWQTCPASRTTWSTYPDQIMGRDPFPTMKQLITEMTQTGQVLMPLRPVRDTLLLFRDHDWERVSAALARVGVKTTESGKLQYPNNGRVVHDVGDDVSMYRVRFPQANAIAFTGEELALGQLSFWENSNTDISTDRFTQRVSIKGKHVGSLTGRGTIIVSPNDRGDVIRAGSVPLEERQGITVLRGNPFLVKRDFVGAAFVAFDRYKEEAKGERNSKVNQRASLVMRYTTPLACERPLFEDFPQQTSEAPQQNPPAEQSTGHADYPV